MRNSVRSSNRNRISIISNQKAFHRSFNCCVIIQRSGFISIRVINSRVDTHKIAIPFPRKKFENHIKPFVKKYNSLIGDKDIPFHYDPERIKETLLLLEENNCDFGSPCWVYSKRKSKIVRHFFLIKIYGYFRR